MLLDRIISRIQNRKKYQLDHENELLTASEFENYLLDEIIFLDQDFEEKLDQEIRNEEAKLMENILIISKLVKEYDLDREVVKNIIYSELNQIFLKNHLL